MGILDIVRSFGSDSTPRRSAADTNTVRKIADELDRLEPDKARYIAAFAYILGRVAHADMDISKEETREMEKIVTRWGEIPPEQAVLVVSLAKTQNLLFGGTENFLVTREFHTIADREQKICLLHCLFEVSASDESISAVEDRTIRQIADELKITHGEFIAIRSAHKDHLEVLKRKPADPD